MYQNGKGGRRDVHGHAGSSLGLIDIATMSDIVQWPTSLPDHNEWDEDLGLHPKDKRSKTNIVLEADERIPIYRLVSGTAWTFSNMFRRHLSPLDKRAAKEFKICSDNIFERREEGKCSTKRQAFTIYVVYTSDKLRDSKFVRKNFSFGLGFLVETSTGRQMTRSIVKMIKVTRTLDRRLRFSNQWLMGYGKHERFLEQPSVLQIIAQSWLDRWPAARFWTKQLTKAPLDDIVRFPPPSLLCHGEQYKDHYNNQPSISNVSWTFTSVELPLELSPGNVASIVNWVSPCRLLKRRTFERALPRPFNTLY
ncbi:unnamed protein product [Fusarium graminearum]|uniref:Uncharacterized protein n=1 Tax=Gibberella zeae TaxID=5518 RepID=A0A679PD74_GIBZA|nr:unnamed protein product [Fusarium graminearum]CZS77783.1 unnamed protein product [Fusarium graminearum]